MKAVILAGGKGTRLAPYTAVFPKPMLPVGDKPILEIIIRQLANYGFDEIILSVGYLAEIIQAYFQNGKAIPENVVITYVKEREPLGTAGAIGLIPNLNESFLVMNGDVLTTLNYAKLLAFHKEKGAFLTIAIHKKEVKMDLGIVETSDDQRVKNYIEKPTYTYYDSMGIYVYDPAVVRYIEPGVYLDLPKLVQRLIIENKKVFSFYHDKPHFWIDIGQHDDYQMAKEYFCKKRDEFLPK